MKRQLGSVALLSCLFQTAVAQEDHEKVPKIEFECGGATVAIDSQPRGFRSPEEAFVQTGMVIQAHILVTRGESQAKFQSWRDIDFIGGTCMQDAQGQPRIVYRAFCGGSGCSDQAWGIIDPAQLREILMPSDNNTARAQEVLGVMPKDSPRLLSLLSGK